MHAIIYTLFYTIIFDPRKDSFSFYNYLVSKSLTFSSEKLELYSFLKHMSRAPLHSACCRKVLDRRGEPAALQGCKTRCCSYWIWSWFCIIQCYFYSFLMKDNIFNRVHDCFNASTSTPLKQSSPSTAGLSHQRQRIKLTDLTSGLLLTKSTLLNKS